MDPKSKITRKRGKKALKKSTRKRHYNGVFIEWKNLTHMGGTIESDAFSLYKNFNGLWYACMFGELKGDVIDMIKTKTNQIVELVEKYKSENTLEEPVYIN